MNPASKIIELLTLIENYEDNQDALVKFLFLDSEYIIDNILEIKLQIILYVAFSFKMIKSSLDNNTNNEDPSFQQNYCNMVNACLKFNTYISNSPSNQDLGKIFTNALQGSTIYSLENKNLLRFWASVIDKHTKLNTTSHETIENTISNLGNISENQYINDAICNLQDLINKNNYDIQSRLIHISLAINALQKSIESLANKQEENIVNNAIKYLNKLILEQAIVQVGVNPLLSFTTNLLTQALSHQ